MISCTTTIAENGHQGNVLQFVNLVSMFSVVVLCSSFTTCKVTLIGNSVPFLIKFFELLKFVLTHLPVIYVIQIWYEVIFCQAY